MRIANAQTSETRRPILWDYSRCIVGLSQLQTEIRQRNQGRAFVGRIQGAVFEVRQGYKSKDAKRQNADISNAANAYANSYLPTVVLLSSQIDGDIAERYTRAQWVILTGTLKGTSLVSTYCFCREVLDYDLAGFFERNSNRIQREIESVTEVLLQ